MQKIIFLVAIASGIPRASVAQAANALHQGVRIEVTPVNAKPQVGTLMALRNDSLFYASGARAQLAWFALADVKSLRVNRGRNHFRGALTKGLSGAALGIITGGLIAAAAWSEESTDFFCGGSRGACAAFGGMVGGGFGLVTGTVYGGIRGDERWERVELPRR